MLEFIAKYWLEFVFSLAISGLTVWFRRISGKVKKQQAVNNGVKALLRNEIVQEYNRYSDKGFCPIYARENIESLYKEYHELGGNGTITELVGKLQSLPTEKE